MSLCLRGDPQSAQLEINQMAAKRIAFDQEARAAIHRGIQIVVAGIGIGGISVGSEAIDRIDLVPNDIRLQHCGDRRNRLR